jgi:hypothetical protein
MVNYMRKYQQTLMIMVTFVVIITFAWLYNDTKFFDRVGADRVGTVYGRVITQAQYLRGARKFEISQMLGLYELVGHPPGQPFGPCGLSSVGNQQSRNDGEDNFVWNNFVLRHEADALGIQPTEQEIVEAVQKIPALQTNGQYDSSKYNMLVANVLNPRGFTTDQLEEIIADSLRLEKIKSLLGATTAAAPSEVRAMFERRNQKTEASVIRLKLEDFKKDVKVSDEDVQKRFEEQKAVLKHPEKRKVKFVAFTLPPTAPDKPALAGKERVAELQKLADQASEFSVAMTEKDAKFDEVAAKAQVKVEETPDFEITASPKELGSSSAVAQAAFKLTNEEPNSDVTTAENGSGYYVLQIAAITPATPMTFEEAKKQLTDDLINERANEALSLKAAEIRKKIEEAIKAGKSFADAAKEAGATPEPFPAFSQAEPKMDQPDAREVMMGSSELAVGQLSDFKPTQTGGLLIYIDKRLPVDESGFEKEKTMIAQNIDRMMTEAAFQQWLKERRGLAGLSERKERG